MNIDLGSFSFGSSIISGGGTPSWGTALGQSKPDYKFTYSGAENIVVGMTYCAVPLEFVNFPLGKGGHIYNGSELNECLLASLFRKVYINQKKIPYPFIMVLIKEDSDSHSGRRSIKYSDKNTYKSEKEEFSNRNFIQIASDILDLSENACWFVYNLEIINQDELHMSAVFVNKGDSVEYTNSSERKNKWIELIPKDLEEEIIIERIKVPTILYGPPGTGKTYKMQKDYISKFADDNRKVTTFHQSFSYEEFVEGLKPVMDSDGDSEIKYRIEDGIFKQACERAAQLAGFENLKACLNTSFEERNLAFSNAINNDQNVLLCIDEINRGNVAAIFGDLISLIETNKRLGVDKKTEMIVKLPYSKEEFGVPANLLIVGTMNTADRSIQLLDTALRRRFKFEELLPQYDKIKNENAVTILKNINARIRCLLNKDNQIGHAYFIHAKNNSEIFSIMINKVIPLLEEYFYNDTEKIRFVLNEDDNAEKTFFIEDKYAKEAYNLYNKEGIEEDKSFYILNEELKQLSDEDKCGEYLANLLNK